MSLLIEMYDVRFPCLVKIETTPGGEIFAEASCFSYREMLFENSMAAQLYAYGRRIPCIMDSAFKPRKLRADEFMLPDSEHWTSVIRDHMTSNSRGE